MSEMNGTLTAEQVRKAIERHSAWVIGNNRCFHDSAYEEIADELNACTMLESEPPRTVYIVESYDSLMEGGYVEPTCYTGKEAAIRQAESLTYDDGGGVRYWARWKELKVAEQ